MNQAIKAHAFPIHPSSFIIHPFLHAPRTGVEPVPTPRQGAMRSVTPTRLNHRPQGELGNRPLATTFTVSGAATTPNSPFTSRSQRVPAEPRMYMRGFRKSGRGGTRTLTAPNE